MRGPSQAGGRLGLRIRKKGTAPVSLERVSLPCQPIHIACPLPPNKPIIIIHFQKPHVPLLGSGMRASSLWLCISRRDRCCRHLETREAGAAGKQEECPAGKRAAGEGTLPPLIWMGPLSPSRGPWARRLPDYRCSGGKLGEYCLRGGDFKGSLIPGDIFRHRSLLFYAADQSPELYK